MIGGTFLAFLDIQITTSSIFAISASMGIPPVETSNVQTAYILAEVITIASAGFLTRLLSTKTLFSICIAGFGVASILCAAAPTIETLTAARFVQGAFGGALVPVPFSAMYKIFPKERQVMVTAIAGSAITLTPTLGPLIGGIITHNLSWPWLFLINVPACMIIFYLVLKYIDIDVADRNLLGRFDLYGFGVLLLFLFALEWTFDHGVEYGWFSDNQIKLSTLFTVLLLVLFVERFITNPNPFVRVSVLKNPSFAFGCVYITILTLAHFGSMYIFPLYLSEVNGYNSQDVGISLIVTGSFQIMSAVCAPTIIKWLGPYVSLIIGFAALTLSLILNINLTYEWSLSEFFGPMALRGAAFMLMAVPIQVIAMSNIPPAQLPDASVIFNFMRNFGAAGGIVAIDTVLESSSNRSLSTLVADANVRGPTLDAIVAELTDRGVELSELQDRAMLELLNLAYVDALVYAYSDALAILGFVALCATVVLVVSLNSLQ